ncbi:MAG: HigA family addiction module antidote protein [Spirulina sp. SIO3F2]|nr:HigA family addiction module antidote protein [Spirulina sp. SIO3F2]
MRIPTHRAPTHPGEMLTEEFLRPLNLSPEDLAKSLYIPLDQLEALLKQQQSLTPALALRLAKYFEMSADFWLNLQLRWDLYHAQQQDAQALAQIRPRTTPVYPN